MKFVFLILLFAVSAFAQTPTLHQKQAAFATLEAKLILKANEFGFEVTLGEAWRSEVVAKYFPTKWYADHGKGIAASLHILRLAIDINLFRGGKFLTSVSDYQTLGEWWEAQSTPGMKCVWGGRFKKLKDGNHFSIENDGRE